MIARDREIVCCGFDADTLQAFTARLARDPRVQRYEVRIGDYTPFDEGTHGL